MSQDHEKFAKDFLNFAELITKNCDLEENDGALRRCVSTAYYALFHYLIAHVLKIIGADSEPQLKKQISRAFTHTCMKTVCSQFSSQDNNEQGAVFDAGSVEHSPNSFQNPNAKKQKTGNKTSVAGLKKPLNNLVTEISEDLESLSGTFVYLQEMRHNADYDIGPNRQFEKKAVKILIGRTKQAFECCDKICATSSGKVFLIALIFQDKWSKH